MFRTPRLVAFLALASLFAGTDFSGTGTVHADSVDDERRKVAQIADQLDALAAKVQQLDDEYGTALDRQDVLTVEIAGSQAKVDAQQAELDVLQGTLANVAIDKFVAGGATELSPLFSTAVAYSAAEQRDQLSKLALDSGAGDSDQLQFLLDTLGKERAILDRKTREAAELITYLDAKRAEASLLEEEYHKQYTQAQADLGQALEDEEVRRTAAAVAKAQEIAAAANAAASNSAASNGNGNGNVTAPGRGGGSTTPGTGGTSSGGGSSTPTPSAPIPSAPAPSGMAGTVIAAAYGQLGVPYKYAAESPGVAFDCSGLTKYAWGRVGVYLPHQSRAQYASLPHVPISDAQPGDLIFYYSPISHVGIYLGGGQLIHSPQTGSSVKIANVNWGKVVGVARPG